MTMQYGAALQAGQMAQIQTVVATANTTNMRLIIYTGAPPAFCGTAASGSVLATIVLPATFLTTTTGSTGVASHADQAGGPWSVAASASGTAGYFRVVDTASACHMQGNVTTDLILNNTSITSGQTVSVTSFGVTAGNT